MKRIVLLVGLFIALLVAPLTLSAQTTPSITLTWTDNSTNEAGFGVRRCLGAGCVPTTEIVRVGANITTYQDPGLLAATTYCYAVFAFNSAGNSPNSNTACAVTIAAPLPPSNLIVK